jgi:type 1 glutamine amidotransferase
MRRREMLFRTGAAVVGASAFPFGWAAADEKKQKVLYFTRSAGYEHPPVIRKGEDLSASEKALTQWGQKAGFEVVCTKDGAVFDGDLDPYDGFAFYTSGDLTGKCEHPQPGAAMSSEGKKKLLAAIRAGKGFVGIHSATDTFRSAGVDPYIAMIGAEFIIHGPQQTATMKVVSPKFPGMEGLGDAFSIHDEWYTFQKFAGDLHVLLVQETEGMKEWPGTDPKVRRRDIYQRPPYPATWAHRFDKGRVFYTSMGHDSIWTAPTFRQVLLGGMAWALGNVEADLTPNIAQVTPGANELKK